jgi:hypothetical protein
MSSTRSGRVRYIYPEQQETTDIIRDVPPIHDVTSPPDHRRNKGRVPRGVPVLLAFLALGGGASVAGYALSKDTDRAPSPGEAVETYLDLNSNQQKAAKDLIDDIDNLRRLNPEGIAELNDEELFLRMSSAQNAVFDIANALKQTDSSIIGATINEEALEALSERGVEFVPDSELETIDGRRLCLNPTMGSEGGKVTITIPIRAEDAPPQNDFRPAQS